MIEKKALRKEIKEKIKALSPEYCLKADKIICDGVFALPQYQIAGTVFCFVSAFGEPDTIPIIEDALANGKRVCVPRCINDQVMNAYEIQSMDDLKAGMYGILEPKESCEVVEPDSIDFALIPCVTCDEDGNRLGHGKGYYDRYLQNGDFFSCMVCRKELMSHSVPNDQFDVRPNMVITD